LRAGLSQADLAARMGTSQSANRPIGKRADAAEHQDAVALRQGDRQQVPYTLVSSLMRQSRTSLTSAPAPPHSRRSWPATSQALPTVDLNMPFSKMFNLDVAPLLLKVLGNQAAMAMMRLVFTAEQAPFIQS